MASVWADLLLSNESGELHAVCSRSVLKAAQFGRKFGCSRTFGQLDDMLAKTGNELDFVYVATPLNSHYAIIERCIDAGVNVLTEKPATQTSDEWFALSQAAKKRGVLLVEGMWMQCLPTFSQAAAWIEQGKIGEVRWIRVDINKFQPTLTGQPDRDTGVLMDYGLYAIRFACHFLGGEPEWSQSHARRDANGNDTDWAIIAGRSGKTAVVNISANSHASSTAAVIGDNGMIEWQSPFNRTNKITLHDFQSRDSIFRHFAYSSMGFEFQLEEVTRSLKENLFESITLNHQATQDTLNFAQRVQGKLRV